MSAFRQQRQQQGRTSSASTSAWEDDAWRIDSDDEDFVKATRVGAVRGGGTNVAAAGSSSASSSSQSKAEKVNNGANSKHFAEERKNTPGATASATARQAPPARPHPYPHSTSSGDRSFNAANAVQGNAEQAEPRGAHHQNVANGQASNHGDADTRQSLSSQPGGSWTLVERSGSMLSAARPTKVEKNAVQAERSGSRERNGSAVEDGEEASLALKSQKEAKHRELQAAVRDDIAKVLEDPTEMLSRLSIRSGDEAGGESSPSFASRSLARDEESAGIAKSTQAANTAGRRPNIDTSNAVIAVDGIVTNLPASSDQFNPADLSVSGRDVVLLSEPTLERRKSVRSERRKAGFMKCLREDVVRMDELKTLAWAGVPDDLRPIAWMLLLGYLPATRSVRAATLSRKRAEYTAGVRLAFQRGTEALDQAIWHQIHIDVPRTNPGITLWQREATQRALERILYVWAIRHPASGYVQGINDLATPFFEVFLSAYISTDPEQYDVALLPPSALEALEADTFWCLSKLLDGIQDNYIFAQPGIQRQVRRMGELVSRINPALHSHLEEQNVEYMQFAFRWMNCLLMRELSVQNIVRMWDSYLAEGPDAFSEFHLFVCAAFLDRWSEELRKMDFQGVIMFLQSLPTQTWTAKETELLLADAFVKKSLFGGTAHLTN